MIAKVPFALAISTPSQYTTESRLASVRPRCTSVLVQRSSPVRADLK